MITARTIIKRPIFNNEQNHEQHSFTSQRKAVHEWLHCQAYNTLSIAALNTSCISCEQFCALCLAVSFTQRTDILSLVITLTLRKLRHQWPSFSPRCLRGIHSWSGGRQLWGVSFDPLPVSDADMPSHSSYIFWCVYQDKHTVNISSSECDSSSHHIVDTEYVSCCGACQNLTFLSSKIVAGVHQSPPL